MKPDHVSQRWVWGGIVLLALIVAGGVGTLLWAMRMPERQALIAVSAAEERWNATRAQHYLIDVRIITLHSGESVRLEVRDEQLVAGWAGDRTTALSTSKLDELRAFFPVTRLFALARAEIERPIEKRERLARAFPPLSRWLLPCALRTLPLPSYDHERGFPRRLLIGLSACQFHRDGIELRIDTLRIIP